MPRPAFPIRRQAYTGNRRRIAVFLDEALHAQVQVLARLERISFSRAAQQLMQRGADSLYSTHPEQNHGN